MMEVALFLVLGAACLLVLSIFARGSEPGSASTAEAAIEAREALHSLQTALLTPELVDRIFAKTDLEFVRAACSPRVQQKFLSERRAIALAWVAQLRQQLLSLKQFHTTHARRFAELNPRAELALAMDFAALLLACRILQLTLYLRGPYAASGMVHRAAGIAGKVCEVSERSLAFLSPPGTHFVEHGSARGSATP
jgi:hypothetical protein